MSDQNERYEVRHYTDACWPHTCATAADLPSLIETLWGRLTDAERLALCPRLGVTRVPMLFVRQCPTCAGDGHYPYPGNPDPEGRCPTCKGAKTITPTMPVPVSPQSHNDYSAAGTPSGSPDAAGIGALDRAG